MSDNEIREAASEPHLDGVLLKKLVLAIVRGNPDFVSEKTDKQRVNAAMKALVGESYKADKTTPGVVEALRWMAEEYIEDRGGHVFTKGKDPFIWLERDCPTARTNLQLAKEAISMFPYATTADNLENKFNELGIGICKAVLLGSDVPGLLHIQALNQIRSILEPLGVSMNN